MILPIDIHTHKLPAEAGQAIVSCQPHMFAPLQDEWYSVGVHPWYADECEWQTDSFRCSFEEMVSHPRVLAVGEAGIDHLSRVSLDCQTDIFRYQAGVAEAVCKPLVIHAVKAQAELIQLKRELKPRVPWIIHGFRGKVQLAQDLVRHGLYLSFGARYQEETLRQIPLDRLFLETDESEVSIASLYEEAARLRGLSCSELREAVSCNIHRVFFGH